MADVLKVGEVVIELGNLDLRLRIQGLQMDLATLRHARADGCRM